MHRPWAGAAGMAFRINHSRVVAAGDAGFLAYPDNPATCLRRRRPVGYRPRGSLGMVLITDESDGNPRALYAASCPMCSTAHPADQLPAGWARGDAADEFGADHRQH